MLPALQYLHKKCVSFFDGVSILKSKIKFPTSVCIWSGVIFQQIGFNSSVGLRSGCSRSNSVCWSCSRGGPIRCRTGCALYPRARRTILRRTIYRGAIDPWTGYGLTIWSGTRHPGASLRRTNQSGCGRATVGRAWAF